MVEVKYKKHLPGSSAFIYQGCMGDLEHNHTAACDQCLEESGERNGGAENEDETKMREPPLDPTLASALQVARRRCLCASRSAHPYLLAT